MDNKIFTVKKNIPIAKSTYYMVLEGDTSGITNCGQFVNVQIEGAYLRRPISVCDVVGNQLKLIYKVVGGGTQKMSEMKEGVSLDILTGLGNGYDLSKSGQNPLLIGGGVGVPPLYMLAKKLVEQGKDVTVILGFNSADEVFAKDEFESLGVKTYIATADGSVGTKGFVTNVMKDLDYSYFYTCGPMPMFRAINSIAKTSGQFSFEERMGCGFGACMGCSCQTHFGSKRVCVDGPVFEREEIVW